MAQKPFVLVTGASGFLGSHVVLQLLDAGYKVRCTARSLKARFLEETHLERGTQFEVVEVEDIANADLTEALRDIEAVIHVAFPAPGSMEPIELLLNGVNSTTNLLRQAYELGIYKFVLTSSYLAIVGAEGDSVWRDYTFTDRDWSTATYDDAFNGTQDAAWVYAAAKKLAEAAAWDFVRSRPSIDLASVVPTLLIGPFAPGHAILSTGDLSTNVLLQSLILSPIPPHPVWPQFVDVRDAASAHIQALEAPKLPLTHAPASAPPPVPSSPPPTNPDLLGTPSFTDASFRSPVPSPTKSSFARQPFKKRFIASGASFTWPDAIAHLRSARPDLVLPDEAECAALPEKVAELDRRWTGAPLEGAANGVNREQPGKTEHGAWRGISVQWRDWKETVEDAVRDLERAAQGLEKSGWEELFEDEDGDEDEEVVLEEVMREEVGR